MGSWTAPSFIPINPCVCHLSIDIMHTFGLLPKPATLISLCQSQKVIRLDVDSTGLPQEEVGRSIFDFDRERKTACKIVDGIAVVVALWVEEQLRSA
jgi:hypothetical protein